MRASFPGLIVVAIVVGTQPAPTWAATSTTTSLCHADVEVNVFSDTTTGALEDTINLSWVPATVSSRWGAFRFSYEISLPADPTDRGVATVGNLTGRPYLFSLELSSVTNAPPGNAGTSRMKENWRLSAAKGGFVFSYGSQTIDVSVGGNAVASKFFGRITGQQFAGWWSVSCDGVALDVPGKVSGNGSDFTFYGWSSYRGALAASVVGLVPAVTGAGTVSQDPNQSFSPGGDGTTSFDLVVPKGTTVARFALFNAFTDGGHDLDLYLYRVRGATEQLVSLSGGPTADEEVWLSNPEPGTYRLWVHGYATDGPTANFTLFTWLLGNGPSENMSVVVPDSVTSNTLIPITLSFTGLQPATKYLGMVIFSGSFSPPEYATIVTIDTP